MSIARFKPTSSKYYDAEIATQLFEMSGKTEHFAAGETLFVENVKSGKLGLFGKRVMHRMYLVKSGEVALSLAGKPLDTIKAGEVFGEMAVITDSATGSTRSTTAIIKADCTTLSLDIDELHAALLRTPEFALMLMSVMFDRMRYMNSLFA